jgi:hypothetical protein
MMLGALLAFAQGASAVVAEVEFNNSGVAGGSVTYDGNGGPLLAEDIPFSGVFGLGTLLNDGAGNGLSCQACLLDFATGDNVSEGPSLWSFSNATSSFVLSGDAVDPGNTLVASGILLTGYFTDVITYSGPTGVLTAPATVFGALSPADMDAAVAAYFSLQNVGEALVSLNFLSLNVDAENGFGGTPSSSKVVYGANTANNGSTVVPLPAGVWLLGFGLAAYLTLTRGRRVS